MLLRNNFQTGCEGCTITYRFFGVTYISLRAAWMATRCTPVYCVLHFSHRTDIVALSRKENVQNVFFLIEYVSKVLNPHLIEFPFEILNSPKAATFSRKIISRDNLICLLIFQHNAEKLLKLIEGVYRWLPLGTIVNNRVLIVHGGISDTTDLDLIRSLDRGKVRSCEFTNHIRFKILTRP